MNLPAFTTRIVKTIDHNPGAFVAILVSAFLLSGCGGSFFAGTTYDVLTGEESTAEEIRAAAITKVREIDEEVAALVQERAALDARIKAKADDEAWVTEQANQGIAAANAETERKQALAQAITQLPIINQLAPWLTVLGIGGWGFDRYRTNGVIRNLKQGSGQTEGTPNDGERTGVA